MMMIPELKRLQRRIIVILIIGGGDESGGSRVRLQRLPLKQKHTAVAEYSVLLTLLAPSPSRRPPLPFECSGLIRAQKL